MRSSRPPSNVAALHVRQTDVLVMSVAVRSDGAEGSSVCVHKLKGSF